MIRRILYEVLLFLLPFALYAIYLRLNANGGETTARTHPWAGLFVSGLVLVAASFVILGLTEGAGQKGVYIPAHVENGRVMPGHVEGPK